MRSPMSTKEKAINVFWKNAVNYCLKSMRIYGVKLSALLLVKLLESLAIGRIIRMEDG